jgi:hypothetical protein
MASCPQLGHWRAFGEVERHEGVADPVKYGMLVVEHASSTRPPASTSSTRRSTAGSRRLRASEPPPGASKHGTATQPTPTCRSSSSPPTKTRWPTRTFPRPVSSPRSSRRSATAHPPSATSTCCARSRCSPGALLVVLLVANPTASRTCRPSTPNPTTARKVRCAGYGAARMRARPGRRSAWPT